MVRKIISLFLCVIMLQLISGNFTSIAHAETAIDNLENYNVYEYIEYAIPHYLSSSEYSNNGEMSYSHLIPVYDYESHTVVHSCVFVFEQNEIVGRMMLFYGDNGYSSVYYESDNAKIQNTFDRNGSLAIVYYNNNVLAFSSVDGYIYLDGTSEIIYPTEPPSNIVDLRKNGVVNNTVMLLSVEEGVSVNLPVSVIGNVLVEGENGEEEGICWASCVAMKMNYQKDMNLYALDVYDAVAEEISYPIGIPEVIERAYELYDYNVTYIDDAVSPSYIHGMLAQDIPVQISIYGTDTAGVRINHGVIISGITIANATSFKSDITLTIVDPNSINRGKILLSCNPTSVIRNISYVKPAGSDRYTNWFATYI